DRTHIGALGDSIRASGDCVSAAGTPAALAAADHNGRVYSFRADASAAAEDRGFLARCGVTLVAATPATVDPMVASVLSAAPPSSVVLVVGLSETGTQPVHLHAA